MIMQVGRANSSSWIVHDRSMSGCVYYYNIRYITVVSPANYCNTFRWSVGPTGRGRVTTLTLWQYCIWQTYSFVLPKQESLWCKISYLQRTPYNQSTKVVQLYKVGIDWFQLCNKKVDTFEMISLPETNTIAGYHIINSYNAAPSMSHW